MRDHEDYPPEEREARQHLDTLRDFVEALPAELYNNNREYWDGKIRAAEILLDELIDRRLGEIVEQPHPAQTAYLMEKAMDADDPRTEWERDWDDYCAEAEETKRDLGEWIRGR